MPRKEAHAVVIVATKTRGDCGLSVRKQFMLFRFCDRTMTSSMTTAYQDVANNRLGKLLESRKSIAEKTAFRVDE
jgi:hypothetical protein